MQSFILLIVIVMTTLILWRLNLLKKINFIVALHLYWFIALVFGYQLIYLFFVEFSYDDDGIFLFVNILLLSYIVLFLLLSSMRIIKKYLPTSERLFLLIKWLDSNIIPIILLLGILFKLFLVLRYGIFYKLAPLRAELGVPYYIEVLDMLLAYPCIGAFFVYIINISVNVKKLKKIYVIPVLLSFYFVFFYFFEYTGGVRRTIIFISLILFLVSIYNKFSLKALLGKLVFLILFVSFINVLFIHTRGLEYESINLSDYLLKALAKESTTRTNLKQRDCIFQLLYGITKEQLSTMKTTNLKLIYYCIINNVLPRFVRSEVINVDEILANSYDFITYSQIVLYNIYNVDITTSVLLIMQSDLSFISYLVTPLLYLILFMFYWQVLLRYYNKNLFIGLCSISMIFLSPFHIEESLEIFFIELRNFLILFIIGFIFYLIKNGLKKVK